MKLSIPSIKQKSKEECWLACIAMILSFYNIPENIAELRKKIKTYSWVWIFTPQLWCYLLKKWFKVEIVSLNQHIFTYEDVKKSQKELVKHFWILLKQEKKNHNKRSLKFFLEFIKLWGKIEVGIPSEKDIQKEISNNRPAIALMTPNFLMANIPWFNFHFNVITGIDNKYIYVNDPLPNNLGWQKKYPINLYMYAIYSTAYADIDNATIIKISKK